ncbi:unnamed protein product, partial [Clonostachys byssicola]
MRRAYAENKERDQMCPKAARIGFATVSTYKVAGWNLWEAPLRPTENRINDDLRLIPELKESHPMSESLEEMALPFSKP